MRIGLLTGGGNMAGVNTVIRAVVKTAISEYGSELVGILDGFEGLLTPPQVRSLGLRDVQAFQRRSNAILGQAPRGNPFEQLVDGARVDRSSELIDSVEWLGLDALIAIGGLGTIALARRVAALGIPILAIPKSTTNELGGTDESVGFSSAVETAVHAIDRLHSVEEQDHLVLYLSVMGREAGWAALAAGLAGGAHVILLPEIPYDVEEICRAIDLRKERGRPSTIVVFASGAHARGGNLDHSATERLENLAREVQARNGLGYEITRLGPIQRGGEPSSRDRVLATQFGAAAVKAAHQGLRKHLVGLRHEQIRFYELENLSLRPRLVDPGSRLIWTTRAQGISLGIKTSEFPAPPPVVSHTSEDEAPAN